MRYHSYVFFTVKNSLYDTVTSKEIAYKKKFLTIIQSDKNCIVYSYVTLGFKSNTSFLLWIQSDTVESIQLLLNTIRKSNLGTYLKITYTLFGISRPTQYSNVSPTELDTQRKGGAYLIIYPFTKTQEWYMFDFKKRKELMNGHISIGRKYPQISQLLLYSYGVDDQEFIVSYETDNLIEFQTLVMELRQDKVRNYTKHDTPIFTCVYKTYEELLDFI